MKIRNFLIGVCSVCMLYACGDDDKRNDTILDMSYITGKDWYYNGWLENKYEYTQNDLLQVIRFEKDNLWKEIDFSGHVVRQGGSWEKQGNSIILKSSAAGSQDTWNILRSGNDYMQVNINAIGTRAYTTNGDWLEDLTADAFYRNEWKNGSYSTHIGAEVSGNRNIREAVMITGPDEYGRLTNKGYHWNENEADVSGIIDYQEGLDVRFYFKILSQDVKLEDKVEVGNMVKRTPEEVGLTVSNWENHKLRIQWLPYDDLGIQGSRAERKVYYKVEVLPEDLNEEKAWFVSNILPAGAAELTLSESTGGEVNKLKEKGEGEHYVVRLVALIFETGVDIYDTYSYANVQAKTYFTTQGMIWK